MLTLLIASKFTLDFQFQEDDSQDEEVLSLPVTIFAKRLKNAIEKLFSQLRISTEVSSVSV